MAKIQLVLLLFCLLLLSACYKQSDQSNVSILSEMNVAEEAVHDSSDAAESPSSFIPLDNMKERSINELTAEDFKLLLITPSKDLDQCFGIKPEDKTEWMMGITANTPLGIDFCYGCGSDSDPLEALYIWVVDTKIEAFPLGYTIDEILSMPQWGPTTVNEFFYATGHIGERENPLKELVYYRDGLQYSFRTDYNNVFHPVEEQDEMIALIRISLT